MEMSSEDYGVHIEERLVINIRLSDSSAIKRYAPKTFWEIM